MTNKQSFIGSGVIVTGAASGIGRETTLEFATAGAKVFATDINSAGLEETLAMWSSKKPAENHGSVHIAVHDVTTRMSCIQAVADAKKELGEIHVLCNIAGISWAEHATNITEEMWDQMLAVNLSGVFWMCQAALPSLLELADTTSALSVIPEPSIIPSIINVASSAGLDGQAYTVPYCATKGGVVLLTKSLALEYAKTGLRVNAVAPGGVETALTQNFRMPADIDPALMQTYTGFRGMSQPEDIANAIMFLASPQAARIHGAILSVDAGVTAG